MNRLHKKCVVASGFVHGILVLVVFVGSAFISPKPPPMEATINLVEIPDIVIDELMAGGGGNPNAAPPGTTLVPPPPVDTPPPQVEQPKAPEPVRAPDPEPEPEPAPVKPKVVEPAPVKKPKVETPKPKVKVAEKPITKPKSKPKQTATKAPPKKAEVKVNLSKAVTRDVPDTSAQKRAAAERAAERMEAARLADQREAALRGIVGNIASQAGGSGTSISIPGPGGPAYAHYGSYLKKLYETTWVPPQAARDDEPVVQVEVTISREGRVLSGKIIKKSGNVSLDRSVQSTLDRISRVKPLPEGTKDEKRTFRINFNLATTKLG